VRDGLPSRAPQLVVCGTARPALLGHVAFARPGSALPAMTTLRHRRCRTHPNRECHVGNVTRGAWVCKRARRFCGEQPIIPGQQRHEGVQIRLSPKRIWQPRARSPGRTSLRSKGLWIACVRNEISAWREPSGATPPPFFGRAEARASFPVKTFSTLKIYDAKLNPCRGAA
jgi:hypothetical protein